MINFLAMISPETMLIVLVVVLVLFGGTKIPQLMRGIGQGVGELKRGMDDAQRQLVNSVHYDDSASAPRTVPPDPTPVPEPAPPKASRRAPKTK